MTASFNAFVRPHNSKPATPVVRWDLCRPEPDKALDAEPDYKGVRIADMTRRQLEHAVASQRRVIKQLRADAVARSDLDQKIVASLRDEVAGLRLRLIEADLPVPVSVAPVTAKEIIAAVALASGHSVSAIRTPGNRSNSLVAARHECVRRLHAAFPHWSMPKLARAVGYSDHTAVLHALKRIGAKAPSKIEWGQDHQPKPAGVL